MSRSGERISVFLFALGLLAPLRRAGVRGGLCARQDPACDHRNHLRVRQRARLLPLVDVVRDPQPRDLLRARLLGRDASTGSTRTRGGGSPIRCSSGSRRCSGRSRSSARSSTCSSGRRSTSRTSASASSRSRRWNGASAATTCAARSAAPRSRRTSCICPVCTTKLRQSCVQCHKPLEALWQVCPYCETPIEHDPTTATVLGQAQQRPPRRQRSR